MAGSGKVKFGETLLAKLLPLAIVTPLFFRLQMFFPDLHLRFDIEQGAYVLAIAIILVVSIIEFRIAQGGLRGFESLNLGSGIAIFIIIVGAILLGYSIATDYKFNDQAVNSYISAYLGFSIIILGIQAIREITGTRKLLKSSGFL